MERYVLEAQMAALRGSLSQLASALEYREFRTGVMDALAEIEQGVGRDDLPWFQREKRVLLRSAGWAIANPTDAFDDT